MSRAGRIRPFVSEAKFTFPKWTSAPPPETGSSLTRLRSFEPPNPSCLETVRYDSYFGERPRVWRCRDHSAGISQSRATPIPRGRRPSIAALTRSGARNASEMVMLTFLRLQPSRCAILPTFDVGSAINSPSHRRPRAMDATSKARVSGRLARAWSGPIPFGKSNSRRRRDGGFCQAT